MYLIKLESERHILDSEIEGFFSSVRTSSLNPNWSGLVMSIGLIVSVKRYIKQQLEKCWVHNIYSPLSQDDLHCYARYKVYYTHWRIDISFVYELYFMSDIRIYALFSCLLLFVDKSCASLHEHHLQTLYNAGCKKSVCVKGLLPSWSFSRPIGDLCFFPKSTDCSSTVSLDSWKMFLFSQKPDLQVVVVKAVD